MSEWVINSVSKKYCIPKFCPQKVNIGHLQKKIWENNHGRARSIQLIFVSKKSFISNYFEITHFHHFFWISTGGGKG